MENDDEMVGRILSRREVVQLIGAGGAAAMFGGAAAAWPVRAAGLQNTAPMPGCVVKPEQTEGPYFVDQQLVRSDIRVEPNTGAAKDGVPLALALTVFDVSNGQCRPLPGATVDIWHCDAQGVYSGVTDPGSAPPARSSCAARRRPTRRAVRSSRPSTRAGTRAARSTSTSRSARRPTEVHGSSPRSGTSMRRSTTASSPIAATRRRGSVRPTRQTASSATGATGCCSRPRLPVPDTPRHSGSDWI